MRLLYHVVCGAAPGRRTSRPYPIPTTASRPNCSQVRYLINFLHVSLASIAIQQQSIIKLINARTLELEEFFDSVLPYTILSHTWGDEEVSFQDMSSPNPGEKAGYGKITMTCQLTLNHNMMYAWVDTWHLLYRQNEQRRTDGKYQLHVRVLHSRASLLRISCRPPRSNRV